MKPVFQKINYLILITGVSLIGLGYLLMIGGGSEDPNVFSEAIFDFRRIKLAPIVCVAGFVAILFAIMYRPKNQNTPA